MISKSTNELFVRISTDFGNFLKNFPSFWRKIPLSSAENSTVMTFVCLYSTFEVIIYIYSHFSTYFRKVRLTKHKNWILIPVPGRLR